MASGEGIDSNGGQERSVCVILSVRWLFDNTARRKRVGGVAVGIGSMGFGYTSTREERFVAASRTRK
jgi:hypothetical protein